MKRSKHALGLFRGVGKFVPSATRKLPDTGTFENATLSLISKGKSVTSLPGVCKQLEKKELIYRAAGRWTTTWKGDAVLKELEKP